VQIKKDELIGAYAQSIGIETAIELIDKKIADSALENRELYTSEEAAKICGELANEEGADPNSRTEFPASIGAKQGGRAGAITRQYRCPSLVFDGCGDLWHRKQGHGRLFGDAKGRFGRQEVMEHT